MVASDDLAAAGLGNLGKLVSSSRDGQGVDVIKFVHSILWCGNVGKHP